MLPWSMIVIGTFYAAIMVWPEMLGPFALFLAPLWMLLIGPGTIYLLIAIVYCVVQGCTDRRDVVRAGTGILLLWGPVVTYLLTHHQAP